MRAAPRLLLLLQFLVPALAQAQSSVSVDTDSSYASLILA